jgi:hypothetical protein
MASIVNAETIQIGRLSETGRVCARAPKQKGVDYRRIVLEYFFGAHAED